MTQVGQSEYLIAQDGHMTQVSQSDASADPDRPIRILHPSDGHMTQTGQSEVRPIFLAILIAS